MDALNKFAEELMAQEREACAKLIEDLSSKKR
jgi:hypothetical protein